MSAEKQHHDLTPDTIADALSFVSPDCSRTLWARMAMALKSELGDLGFDIFDAWSRGSDSHNPTDARDTWKSVRPSGGVTINTLIREAMQGGFRFRDDRPRLPPEAVESRKREREQREAEAAAELKRIQGEAARIANVTWQAAAPGGDEHAYCAAKGVRAFGLAVGAWPLINKAGEVFRHVPGTLLIPIVDVRSGKIISLQGIQPGGEKRYLTGGRKRGGFHMIGPAPEAGGIVVLCEGYATGASIHEITGWTVLVCFDGPNLAHVATLVREVFPKAAYIVAADNDQWTTAGDIANPGAHYGAQAGHAATGYVVTPKFTAAAIRSWRDTRQQDHGGPTDFNDLAALEGREVAFSQLMDNAITAKPSAPAIIQDAPAPPASAKPSNDNVDIYTPLTDTNAKGKPLATIENVAEVCNRLGVTVRYNVITKEEEILIPGESFSVDNAANASLAWLESWCARFNLGTEKLGGFVTYLSDRNLYNPVAAWIMSKPWDGTKRLQALCDTVTPVEHKLLPDGRRLSDVLITRWMMSALAAAFSPDGVSAHGILTLQGPQYLGKTMWFKQLAPASLNVLQDGMILRPDDRDSVKQICSFWLVELGELDATFRKSDIAALKSFITRKQDVLRRAYAKKESTFARRTVFFGSVNPKEYLHDPTGNRRYWTIECAALNVQHGLDMQQVWAEALELYRAGEGYYLTPDEMAALNAHNESFMTVDPVEERLQTRLDWVADKSMWRWLTATEILIQTGLDKPTTADATKASHFLRKLNGGQARRSNGRNLLMVPPLERMSTMRMRSANGDDDAPF